MSSPGGPRRSSMSSTRYRPIAAGLRGCAGPLGGVLLGVGVEAGGDGVGPGVEARLVLARDAQQTADHGDGEAGRRSRRRGRSGPCPAKPSIRSLTIRASLAAHGVDPAGRVRRAEGAHGQAAQPVVLGGVESDEGRRQGRLLGRVASGARCAGCARSELIRGSCSRPWISW